MNIIKLTTHHLRWQHTNLKAEKLEVVKSCLVNSSTLVGIPILSC
jgi:hypothetical protein